MPTSKTPINKRPVSDRQLAANRANAQSSTGPRTPQGKARSAQNARRHGFAARHFTVVGVDEAHAVAKLKDDLVAFYQPVNSQELFALERLALAQHTLLRAARLEAGLFTLGVDEAMNTAGEPEDLSDYLQLDSYEQDTFALAKGFRRVVSADNTWALFLRYQAQAERNHRRAIQEFERLKALRDKTPNEPNSSAQPRQNTPLPNPETNPSKIPETDLVMPAGPVGQTLSPPRRPEVRSPGFGDRHPSERRPSETGPGSPV